MYVFTTCVGGLLYTRPPSPDDDVLEKPLLVIIRYVAYSMLAETIMKCLYVCMYVCMCMENFRHGKTEHNKLGLFTGWEDANLGTYIHTYIHTVHTYSTSFNRKQIYSYISSYIHTFKYTYIHSDI